MPPPETGGDRRQAIIDAAIACFHEEGFAAARIADVATRAGIGKGTVYEYFATKDELLVGVCMDLCRRNELATGLGDHRPPELLPEEPNPVRFIHDFFATGIAVMLESSRREQHLFSELALLHRRAPTVAQQACDEFSCRYRGWFDLAAGWHRQGVERGWLRPVADLEVFARFVVASIDGLIWQSLWLPAEDPQQVARRVAAMWCELIIAPDRSLVEALS